MSFFYPEVTLGAEELSSGRRGEIGDFLVDVIRQRGFPLHLANLWNALYFRWDLEQRQYVAATIEPSRIPVRRMNERDEPLPLGAFMRVETQTKAGNLWAEVIYKEGAHPGVTADYLPSELCGSPGDVVEAAGRRVVVLRERLVLDLTAFGPRQNVITPVGYERLLRRERWLDSRGHLVVDAVYQPEDAQLQDVNLYVNYLLERHREGLMAFCFTEEPSDSELREGLLRSFAAIRDICLARRELSSWRQKFFFDRVRYREQVASEGDLPLGASDLGHLFGSLKRLPRDRRVAYAAIGPWLDDLFSEQGYDEEERALMRGPVYAMAVAYSNSFIRDRLEAEAREGLIEGGKHLRLDDDWQAGGVWRCERIDGPNSITLLPPDLPLHLGLAEAVGVLADDQPPPPMDEEVTVRTATRPLSREQIRAGRLPLSSGMLEQLADAETFTLRLRHNGETVDQSVALDSVAKTLVGISWPPSFFPGIKVSVNAEHGGTVIKVRTTPLLQPTVIDGVALRHDFSESVYRREVGGPQLSAEERRAATTLADLICSAFHRYGHDAGGTRKALSYQEAG